RAERRKTMSFFSWLRNRTTIRWPRGRTGPRPAASRSRPLLEALEDRTLPSTLTVLNLNDGGPDSLRYEIAAAQSGDTIHFAGRPANGSIKLTSGELIINKSLDIEWQAAGALTVSGNNASRVFDIQGSVTVTLSGLTIANGRVVDDLGGSI